MREVWLSSHAPKDWSRTENPPLILLWWITYILGGAASRIASTMLKDVD